MEVVPSITDNAVINKTKLIDQLACQTMMFITSILKEIICKSFKTLMAIQTFIVTYIASSDRICTKLTLSRSLVEEVMFLTGKTVGWVVKVSDCTVFKRVDPITDKEFKVIVVERSEVFQCVVGLTDCA